jgi:hypothetical protein
MLQRYIQISGLIDRQDDDLIPYLLDPREDAEVRLMVESLKKVNDVTVTLQGDDINLSAARILLDAIIALNLGPDPTLHISADSQIVKDVDFERGLVKLIDGDVALLTSVEKDALVMFKRKGGDVDNGDELTGNFALDSLRAKKKRKVVNESTYIDASFVPATSVLAEREFSQSSLVFSELRQAMTPLHLECVLFLKHNSWLWESLLVQEVLNSE